MAAVTEKKVERRKYPRAKADFHAEIDNGFEAVRIKVDNISLSGIYCEVDKKIPLMTKLDLNMLIPTTFPSRGEFFRVLCTSIVVRTEPSKHKGKYNIAILFSSLSESARNKVSSYIVTKNLSNQV